MFKFRLAIVLLVAGFLNVDQLVKGVPQFKRCYNTSDEETHCFDVQYDTATDQPFPTSFQNAIMRCQAINSTLVVIKNEEIDNLVQQFMKDSNNPIWNQYFWLNAYQVSYYDSPFRWHWLNSTLPNLAEPPVTYIQDSGWYTAALEFRTDSGISQFYLTAKQPQSSYYYVCEYPESNCSSASSNDVRVMNGRCYKAVQEEVTWYEARNRCLIGGGDLASFLNVTDINFTPWLGSVSFSRYWIGLRSIWYTWGDRGQELKYTNWAPNDDLQKPCMIYCVRCIPPFTWLSITCSQNNMYVVCHTITSLKMTTAAPTNETAPTTSTIILPANTSTFTTESLEEKEASTSRSIIPLAVGVGIGVGVPVIAGIAVMIICIVRKRQHATESSVKSANRQQAESSIDQPFDAATADDRSEVGDNTTYGVVVPSKSPREADEANEANSPAEQTVYAPLQIL